MQIKSEYSLGVIIPIYNVEEYLYECLDSVVNQTLPFDEVILVNDGSSDKSKEICECYCKNYSNFQLIDQRNQGQGAARNHGMRFFKSDYLMFLDSDDCLISHTVEIVKKKLRDQDILFFASEIKEDMEGIVHPNLYLRNEKFCNHIMSGLEFFYCSYPENYIVSCCMSAYKSEFLKKYKITFPEGLFYEDNYFYIKLILHAKKVESIPDQLYIRRYRFGSTTTTVLDKKRCFDQVKIQLKIWDYIKERPIIEEKKDFWFKFVLQIAGKVTNMIEECDDVSNEEVLIPFLEKFIEDWERLCELELLSLNDHCTFLKIYEILLKSNREKYFMKYKEIAEELNKKMRKKLEVLHLNNPFLKIGIYGMGKHTEAMLFLYEKYYERIESRLFYIVTENSKCLSAKNDSIYPIVTYKSIPKDTDKIIISSFLYMNDMIKNLETCDVDFKKICKLYRENETTDLIMIYETIKRLEVFGTMEDEINREFREQEKDRGKENG